MHSELHVDVAGSGTTALYLHGLGDSGALPPVLVEAHPDRTWVRPTHPGFLDCEKLSADSIREVGAIYAKYLRDLLAERGEERCTVLGASLGGWIGAELLIQVPELIEQIVLLSPAGLDANNVSPPLLDMNGLDVLRLASLPRPEQEEYLLPTELVQIMEINLAATRKIVSGARLKDTKLAQQLAETSLDVPVKIYWGAHDAVLPRSIAREWKAALPAANVVILPNTGHGVLASPEFSLAQM